MYPVGDIWYHVARSCAGGITDTQESSLPGLRILRRLAVGGMAELFLAVPDPPVAGRAPVVVKRLLPGFEESQAHLFDRERRVLGCLSSSNVVRLLGAGPDHLVLEYVDGPDLSALLGYLSRRGRRMPLGAAVAVIGGILDGLADLHDATDADGTPLGAVHRDMNPSNVLVSRAGDVKVADLGVVHLEVPGQPTLAGLKGTLAYMAPEQLLGRPVDRRTDVYAAGLVAYEVLTGTPARPARMAGVAELMEARSRLPAPPSTVRPDLPPALDAWVLAALEPLPAARPAGIREWRRGLEKAAGTGADREALASLARGVGPVVARASRTLVPDGPGAPASGAGASRRRWMWTGAALVLVAGLAAGGLLGLDAREGAAGGAEAGRLDAGSVEARGGASVGPAPGEPAPALAVSSGSASADPAAVPGPAIDPAAPGAAPVGRAPASGEPPSPARNAAGARHTPVLGVEVRPIGGPVHVDGPGARGLAPRGTGDLPEGATLLTLHGDAEHLPPALVRLVRSGDGVTATIGTVPERHFDRIRCGGKDVGETSVVGIRLEGETRCQVTGEDASMAFALAVVRR